jgi:DNA-binding NarL/FixJ family response regulator
MQNDKIKIVIADDHQIFRESLSEVLTNSESYEILGEAANGKELLVLLEKVKPDIVIMDIAMPEMDGIEGTIRALQIDPDLKIIVLSMYCVQEYYHKLIHAGIKGFVLKKTGIKELKNAISDVIKGRFYFSSELIQNIVINYSNSDNIPVVEEKKTDLSRREIEILKLFCSGMTNGEISKVLNISLKTVDSHKLNILCKTNSKNIVGMVLYAIKMKLIEI